MTLPGLGQMRRLREAGDLARAFNARHLIYPGQNQAEIECFGPRSCTEITEAIFGPAKEQAGVLIHAQLYARHTPDQAVFAIQACQKEQIRRCILAAPGWHLTRAYLTFVREALRQQVPVQLYPYPVAGTAPLLPTSEEHRASGYRTFSGELWPTNTNSNKDFSNVKIIEQKLLSKAGNPDGGEDRIFIGKNIIAIIDGVTAKTEYRFGGKTPGLIAVELLMNALEVIDATAQEGECASAVMHHLDRTIEQWYFEQGRYEEVRVNPAQRCAASIVIYNAVRQELWFVGDCQAYTSRHITNEKKIDQITSGARSLFLQAAVLEGGFTVDELRQNDPGRAFILPLLKKQTVFQNRMECSWGFAVLDGFWDARGIRVERVQTNEHEIVLASDGYPELEPTLEESERRLQEIIEADPLCIGPHKATKGLQPGNVSFDDRAYIRFQRGNAGIYR